MSTRKDARKDAIVAEIKKGNSEKKALKLLCKVDDPYLLKLVHECCEEDVSLASDVKNVVKMRYRGVVEEFCAKAPFKDAVRLLKKLGVKGRVQYGERDERAGRVGYLTPIKRSSHLTKGEIDLLVDAIPQLSRNMPRKGDGASDQLSGGHSDDDGGSEYVIDYDVESHVLPCCFRRP